MKLMDKNTELSALEKSITLDFKNMDVKAFKKIMKEYGVVVCKDVLPVLELKVVRDLIYCQVFPRMKLGRDLREDLKDKEQFPQDLKIKTITFLLEGVSDLHEIDKDKLFQKTIEKSGVGDFLKKYWEKESVQLVESYFYARTVDPLENKFKLGLHQDGTFLRGLGLGGPERFMICWTPLVSVWGNAPGLELIARPFNEIYETRRSSAYHGTGIINDQELIEQYKDYLIQPKVNVGDMIIFDGFTPHRTYLNENMVDVRTSIDVRFYYK